jgi:hypothetical protein
MSPYNQKKKFTRNLSTFLANSPDPKNILLTDRDLAELSGLSAQYFTVGRCRGTLSLPFVKIGKSVRVRLSDFQGWIQDHTVRNGTEG